MTVTAPVGVICYSILFTDFQSTVAVGKGERNGISVCSEGYVIAFAFKIGNNLLFAGFVQLTVDCICWTVSTHNGTNVDITLKEYCFSAYTV